MMEGAIFGEIAFCLRQTGTADVVSETTADHLSPAVADF